MRTAQVAVTDVAAALTSSRGVFGTLKVHNAGANSVFIGDSAVSTTTGYEVASGATVDFAVSPNDALSAVCAATLTSTVHIYEN